MTMYTDRLLSYWHSNKSGWRFNHYTHTASLQHSDFEACHDEVEFRVKLNDTLAVVNFWARGCAVAECATAMLAELATGKPLAWLDTFTDEDWIAYVNAPLTPFKRQCALLPLQCLRKAVSNG